MKISISMALTLIVLCVVIAFTLAAGISFDYVSASAAHADGNQAYLIGGIYGDHWDSFRWEPFSRGIQSTYWLICLLYYGLVTTFGYALIGILVGKCCTFAVQFPAGFLIGYPAVVAVNRLVTLLMTDDLALSATFILLMILTVTLLISAKKNKVNQLSLEEPVKVLPRIITYAGVLLTTSLLIIYEIQNGRAFMVRDSTLTFIIPKINEYLSLINEAKGFPLVNVQYDELLFNYPLWSLDAAKDIAIVPFWLTNALAKSSFIFLIILLLGGRLGFLGRLVAVATATYVMIGSASAIPWHHINMFGAGNPLLYGGYPGRLLAIIVPFIVIGFFQHIWSRNDTLNSRQISVIALLALGLSGTSANVGIYLICSVFIALLSHATNDGRRTSMAGVALLITVPFLVYQGNSASFYSPLLLIAGLVGCLWCLIAVNWGSCRSKVKEFIVPSLAILVSLLFGWIFMGNLLSFKLADLGLLRFGPYVDDWLVREAARIPGELKWFEFSGDVNANTKHWLSPTSFAAFYGTSLVFILSGVVLANQRMTSMSLKGRCFQYYLACAIFFILGLFYTDFISDGNHPWIKNRMIEVPFYSAILFTGFLFARLQSVKTRLTVSVVLLVWSFVSFVSGEGLRQLWINTSYLGKFIFGSSQAVVVGIGNQAQRTVREGMLSINLSKETLLEISAPHDGVYSLGEFYVPPLVGRYEITLDLANDATGRDPVMQIGKSGQGDLIFIERHSGEFRIGIDHWGTPTVWSPWQPLVTPVMLKVNVVVSDKIEVFAEGGNFKKTFLVASAPPQVTSGLSNRDLVFGENRVGFTTAPKEARFSVAGRKDESKLPRQLIVKDTLAERTVQISNACPTVSLVLKGGVNEVKLSSIEQSNNQVWGLRGYVFLTEVDRVSAEKCER